MPSLCFHLSRQCERQPAQKPPVLREFNTHHVTLTGHVSVGTQTFKGPEGQKHMAVHDGHPLLGILHKQTLVPATQPSEKQSFSDGGAKSTEVTLMTQLKQKN